jgi:hypothetical protein
LVTLRASCTSGTCGSDITLITFWSFCSGCTRQASLAL